MKVIVVETDEMDNRANRIVFNNRINPASISRIVEKRLNDKAKNVCVVFMNGDELNLSPEEWAERKIVEDTDLDTEAPDMASRPDGVTDACDTIPNAPCCRIGISSVLTLCEEGLIKAPDECDEKVRTVIEAHTKILGLIKGQAEKAYKYAGGRL